MLLTLLTIIQTVRGQSPGASWPAQVTSATDLCYNGGQCLAPASCAPHYLTSLLEPTALCYLSANNPGVCCPPHIPSCECDLVLKEGVLIRGKTSILVPPEIVTHLSQYFDWLRGW